MTTVNHTADFIYMVFHNHSSMYEDRDSGNVSSYDPLLEVMAPSSARSSCIVFQFVFFTIFTGLLCILGFTGNVISMYVLQKDCAGRMYAATFLLQALAVADNCVLGMSFMFLSIVVGLFPMLNALKVKRLMTPYIVVYIQPVAQMAQAATVWVTVLLAINRYIAVCRPFDTHRLSSLKKTKLQVAAVFTFAFLINFPRFFQYRIEHHFDNNLNTSMPRLITTSIGPRKLFGMVYAKWLYSIIILLLPFLLLLVLNIKLIIELGKMSKRRESLTSDRRSEENITQVNVIIIIVFVICNTPDRINELVKYFNRHPMCSGWFYYDCVCQIFVVANSSTNFLIYYIFRRRFRQVLFRRLFGLCCPGSRPPISTNDEHNKNRQSNNSSPRTTLTQLSTNGATQHNH